MKRKIISAVLALMLCLPLTLVVWAAEEPSGGAGEIFLYDEAGLLSQQEQAHLSRKLEELSHAHETQLVVATRSSLGGRDIDSAVEEVYDSMGFGYGETREGVLLLVCMDSREYRILSNGHAGVAIGPKQIDALCDRLGKDLPHGRYGAAFDGFADQCAQFLTAYEKGAPFPVVRNLAISLGIGLAVGGITAFVLKGQLKSVRGQSTAHAYVKQGSMHLSRKSDRFLYRNVTRTQRPKVEESASSDSSGSGGTDRSVGGGSF